MKQLFVFGPILFIAVVLILTFVEYDFLRGLGWDPITAVTIDWPSGLALGPYGWWMNATFIVSGLLMFLFAFRLHTDLKPGAASQIGSMLLASSGLAMAGLAFNTDPTFRTTPATWHGVLHNFFFVLLGCTLLPAMFFLGRSFREDPRWQNLSLYTWATAGFAIPAFALKGFAFYIFLALVLVWNEIIAWRYYFHEE